MVFSFASIVSTGFSTWSIVEVATANVNAGGDGVIALNDAISFFPPLYDFSFCIDGMVKDHVIVTSGNILVTAIIDNAKASKFVSNNKYNATVIFEETTNTGFLTYVAKKPIDKYPNSGTIVSIGDNLSSNPKVIKNMVAFNVSSAEKTTLNLNYVVTDVFNSTTEKYESIKFYSNPPHLFFSILLETNP